jgi:hypothetical protein
MLRPASLPPRDGLWFRPIVFWHRTGASIEAARPTSPAILLREVPVQPRCGEPQRGPLLSAATGASSSERSKRNLTIESPLPNTFLNPLEASIHCIDEFALVVVTETHISTEHEIYVSLGHGYYSFC